MEIALLINPYRQGSFCLQFMEGFVYRLPGNILEDLVVVGLAAGNAVGIQFLNGAHQHGF